MSTILTPKYGESRIKEMTSIDTSPDTKCWAARWYAEMVIDLFLSKAASERVENFEKLSLGNKIKEISTEYSNRLIDALYFIESHGNEASHFSRDIITSETADKVVDKAITLFDLILVDLFKDNGLAKTPNTARLFSTFTPSIRANVLNQLLDFNSLDNSCEHDMGILHKYFLALTKNNQRDKARRLLYKLKKQNKITQDQFQYWEESINKISSNINNLPIPKNISDCKRNFDNVLSSMDIQERELNSQLIEIFNTLLDSVTPSEMDNLLGDQVFLV